ncbi:MAG: hypothetical protein IJS09_08735 [Treponema sp.]|nr:hypothetical protein [Treponema sp.]
MKAKQLFEKARENWLAKVICFVAALFFYLFFQLSTLDRKSFSVPLRIEAKNGMVAASSYPQNVKVTVRGKLENISTLHESDFSAFIDLDYISREGKALVPVQLTLSKNAMLLDTMELKVSPEHITLEIEEQISAYVPVNPLVSGDPAHGYELKSVEINPPEVRVTGPRSMVNNCRRLQTKMVSIADIQTDKEMPVQLESPGRFLHLSDGEKVTLTAKVTPKLMVKRFDSAIVNLSGLRAEFEPTGSGHTILLSLRGPVLSLENYAPRVSTVLADCKGIDKEGVHEVPLVFNLPAGTVALDETPKRIRISVKRKPTEEDVKEVPAKDEE